MSFTVVSMTASLLSVFIPILLMSGVIGRLFREFAMTVGAAVQCNVAASAGTFTVPSYVLLRLPAGNFSGFEFAPAMAVAPFSAKGAAVGIIDTNHDGTAFGGFPLN